MEITIAGASDGENVVKKTMSNAKAQRSKEFQMKNAMVRQAHHDLFIHNTFQDSTILSLSKDRLWHSFDIYSPLVHHFVRTLKFGFGMMICPITNS